MTVIIYLFYKIKIFKNYFYEPLYLGSIVFTFQVTSKCPCNSSLDVNVKVQSGQDINAGHIFTLTYRSAFIAECL